jgi:hypothetical protein
VIPGKGNAAAHACADDVELDVTLSPARALYDESTREVRTGSHERCTRWGARKVLPHSTWSARQHLPAKRNDEPAIGRDYRAQLAWRCVSLNGLVFQAAILSQGEMLKCPRHTRQEKDVSSKRVVECHGDGFNRLARHFEWSAQLDLS